MIDAPPSSVPPSLGPLQAPAEQELAAAYPALQGQALTLSWAAVALGCQVARLEALARAGELLVIPGPWRMRQAGGSGYFVPAWQLVSGGRGPNPELPALLAAAASAGWSSLELHRFMTAPLRAGGTAPAKLLRAGAAAEVVALIREDDPPHPAPLPARTRRSLRSGFARACLRKTASRRHVPPGASEPAAHGGTR